MREFEEKYKHDSVKFSKMFSKFSMEDIFQKRTIKRKTDFSSFIEHAQIQIDAEKLLINDQEFQEWHQTNHAGLIPLVINGGAGMGKPSVLLNLPYLMFQDY